MNTYRRHRSSIHILLLLLSFLFLSTQVLGHEVRPAYLQLKQTAPEKFNALWKVPGVGENLRLGIYVKLPPNCKNNTQPRGAFVDNSYTEQWSFSCIGGLVGGAIEIQGLSATKTDALIRIECLDGTTQVARLTPSAPSFVVEAAPNASQVAITYLRLGVEHILTGWDHLLYILAMLLLVGGWRRVVLTMSAFTATHSLTLTAAALGWVHVPQPPVEACIALSILFVASEIVRSRQGRPGLTQRWPWAISFTFGLMHGLGFAGALSEVGLPQKAIPAALLFFNLGVEAGQILFIAFVFAIAVAVRKVARRITLPQPTWVWRIPPYAIGAVAAFWFIQRIGRF